MSNKLARTSIGQIFGKLEPITLRAIFFSISLVPKATSILIILFVLVSFPNFKKNYLRNLWHRKDMLLYIMMYLLLLLGLIYSIELDTGLSKIQTQLSMLIFPLILGGQSLSEKSRQDCIQYFIFGLTVAVMLCFGNALYRAVSNGSFYVFDEFSIKNSILVYHEFSALLDLHPTYFSLYLSVGLFCFIETNSLKTKLNSWTRIFLAGLFFIALFLTSSKAGIFSFIAIALGFYTYKIFLQKRKIHMRILILLIVGVIAMFVINPILYNRSVIGLTSFKKAIFEDKHLNESTSIRYYLWELSFETSKESFLLGHGTGSVGKILNERCLEFFAFSTCETLRNKNSHSQYLNFLVSNGAIFVLIFVLTLIIGIIRAYYTRDKLFILFILLMSLNFMFESLLQRERGIVFFMLFVVMLSVTRNETEKK